MRTSRIWRNAITYTSEPRGTTTMQAGLIAECAGEDFRQSGFAHSHTQSFTEIAKNRFLLGVINKGNPTKARGY